MAYMSQEKKRELAPRIKDVLKRYGVKGSISVHHYSQLVVKIKSGPLDFFTNYRNALANKGHSWDHDTHWLKYPEKKNMTLNGYHYKDQFTGEVLAFVDELQSAMNVGNHDNSDSMTDYFDVGWYTDIRVGEWDKAYVLTGPEEAKTERLIELEEKHGPIAVSMKEAA